MGVGGLLHVGECADRAAGQNGRAPERTVAAVEAFECPAGNVGQDLCQHGGFRAAADDLDVVELVLRILGRDAVDAT